MRRSVRVLIVMIVVFAIGTVFNLAINVLGSFVHSSRLQYVEFFSHFYTGDGELFKPLGSSLKHVYIKYRESSLKLSVK